MASNLKRKSEQDNNNGRDNKKLRKFYLSVPKRPTVQGKVLVCGQGDAGQLGLGDDVLERMRPTLVAEIENAVDVQAGGMHNLVLSSDGRVWSFGCNDEGALGRDTSGKDAENKPGEVKLPVAAVRISAGDSHSACILEDGRCFAWGTFRDSHGSMGLTIEGKQRFPIEIMEKNIVAAISSGTDHLVILTCSGKVYTMGCAEQGQLGRVTSRSISGEGRAGKRNLLLAKEVTIRKSKPIEAIFTTSSCTFLRESQTGYIWAFGLNNYNQLGFSTEKEIVLRPVHLKLKYIKQIVGGLQHTIFLKDNGMCFAIGNQHYGRLGLGTVNSEIKELQYIRKLHDEIVSISCGDAHSFAMTEEGYLYAWGNGSNYQLGMGVDDDALEPVRITCKKTEDSRFLCARGGGQHSIFLQKN